jgi:hypothetical protein
LSPAGQRVGSKGAIGDEAARKRDPLARQKSSPAVK